MRLGSFINYSGGFTEAVGELQDSERAGLDLLLVPEAYSFDAVSQLGYLAARTERLEIASGILPLYSRTPALTAMTAAGLDFVSGGRFTLGLGASGPQVVEGFHGLPYEAPLGRTREIVEICRTVWRRERLAYDGTHYRIPYPPERGTGLGKPLKLVNHPVRERIPVMLAALGPRNVALTAEIAEVWQPVFFYPEKAGEVWGEALEEGTAKRDPGLGELDVAPFAIPCAIGEGVAHLLDEVRPQLALYVGGMGAKGRNFYNTLAQRYGFEAAARRIQDLYLDGKKDEAAAAVPDELIRGTSLIGPESYVAERLAAFAQAGARTIVIRPLATDAPGRLATIETLRSLLP
jgi:F420-dependent oxidoreductase-like protein